VGIWRPRLTDTSTSDDRRGTSLAYTRQTEPTTGALTCENAPRARVIELYSGEVFPAGCRKLTCQACLPRLARRRTMAITAVEPRRMIRLSLVADPGEVNVCKTALNRVSLIRRNLGRMGIPPGEWTLTIERNPNGTGYHAHCLQTGTSIAQSSLQSACEAAHAGIPYINSIYRHGIWSARYGLKGFGADGYGLKTFRSIGSAQQALAINNGRLEHHSRDFFTIRGKRYGVRAAERAALAIRNEGKPTIFHLTQQDEAERLSADSSARRYLIDRYRAATPGAGRKGPPQTTSIMDAEGNVATFDGWLRSGDPVQV
jgi:hypothetical protein